MSLYFLCLAATSRFIRLCGSVFLPLARPSARRLSRIPSYLINYQRADKWAGQRKRRSITIGARLPSVSTQFEIEIEKLGKTRELRWQEGFCREKCFVIRKVTSNRKWAQNINKIKGAYSNLMRFGVRKWSVLCCKRQECKKIKKGEGTVTSWKRILEKTSYSRDILEQLIQNHQHFERTHDQSIDRFDCVLYRYHEMVILFIFKLFYLATHRKKYCHSGLVFERERECGKNERSQRSLWKG